MAAQLGAAYVDVELKAAEAFFAAGGPLPPPTRLIVSSHNYDATPSEPELRALLERLWEAGADVAKLAVMARDVGDAARVLRVLRASRRAAIMLAMGERGQITRLLAPKYGGHLTFGALSPERASAPGQPTLQQLVSLYRLPAQARSTRVFGIVGNPVSHRRVAAR